MTDQLGVKQLCRLLQQSYFFALLLVFSCTPLTCNGLIIWHEYRPGQLNALQALLGEWNKSTPELKSNLAGWTSSQAYPCLEAIGLLSPGVDGENWRGVQCLTNFDCKIKNETSGDETCSALITGLTVNSASIVGILPPEIGNITTLTTLELIGNPNLTGTLPQALEKNTNLHILNLSGNNFSGSFPHSQISSMVSLQTFDLSRNNFEGGLDAFAFESMTQLIQLDLSNNRFIGSLPIFTSTTLRILDMSKNSFTGALPNLTTMSSLSSVNLSRNALAGPISAFNILTGNNSLSVLDLSHNQLTGPIESWNSSEFGSLEELYLDYNRIDGTLNISKLFVQGKLFGTKSANSSSGLLRVLSLMNNSISNVDYKLLTNIEDVTTSIRLEGNPYCVSPDSDDGTRCFCKQVCFNLEETLRNDRRKVVIIAAVTSAISVLLMISLGALLHRHRRYQRHLRLQEQEIQRKFEEFEVKPTIFPYNQLRTATQDFHSDMKLGQGAFGAVYKGILPNGNVLAVKQLFSTNQGIDEFLNEVVLLTGMKHRNLVNLKGCCIREQERLLVYEYVDNYDIDKILFAGPNKVLLSWPVRLKICLGVARGLHYLHALAHPKIIHRDIKASNILMAQNYETKIADFGLASLFPDEESYIMTKHVAGTKGYLAPEYATYGQLSDKVDVYSFGVLCLEVVSGRRNIDEKLPLDEMYLTKWAWELLRRGNLMELVDPTMSLQDEEKLAVHRLINIALLCIQFEAEQRPSMERVVAMLQGDSESEAVAPKPVNEELLYLDSKRLFGAGESGLATVKEEAELSFINSSRKGAGRSEDDLSTGAAFIELSEIRVR